MSEGQAHRRRLHSSNFDLDEHSRRQPRQQVLDERVGEGDGAPGWPLDAPDAGWLSPSFIHCVPSPVRLVSVRP
ncbi:hypothetical protein D7147_05385 [Micromonospora musae]|uniref:Uncharacterized protein n=1 Tax=Micromonospora musae TaxID=1894970 RepID=A0A3A9YK92_9ACTN|nr:hypothetical protein [Micromonospora musae]RKN22146.1 hypothetical protein D7147_05385 [Micromonospora musae]RKN33907.1 hypothetical protein D7044_09355 [Micromonospora musae]